MNKNYNDFPALFRKARRSPGYWEETVMLELEAVTAIRKELKRLSKELYRAETRMIRAQDRLNGINARIEARKAQKP